MNCNIVRDLLPLYIDKCCSEESTAAVEDHLKECEECRAILGEMTSLHVAEVKPKSAPQKLTGVRHLKASVIQSVLLFFSFAIITVGVALEASTGSFDLTNGFWAFNLVIPATGFMLSLANWYFLQFYKSRRSFSICSCLFTIVFTLCAFVWVLWHYEIDLFSLGVEGLLGFFQLFFGIGSILFIILCFVSKLLSDKYARLLGKE